MEETNSVELQSSPWSIPVSPDIQAETEEFQQEEWEKQVIASETPELHRLRIMTEIGEYESASRLAKEILWNDPENGWAYYYSLFVHLNISEEKDLFRYKHFSKARNFILAQKFADELLRKKLEHLLKQQQEKLILTQEKENLQKVQEEQQRNLEMIRQAKNRAGERIHCLQQYLKIIRELSRAADLQQMFEARITAENELINTPDPQMGQVNTVETETLALLQRGNQMIYEKEQKNRSINIIVSGGIILFTVLVIWGVLQIC